MILKYGSYAHPSGEVSIVVEKSAVESDTGIRTAFIEAWTITGWLHADSVAELTAAIAAMESAYSVNGYDLGLYEDDGTTLTAHAMDSSEARGGVRILSIRYPEGEGAEYTTFRKFEIRAEAEFAVGVAGLVSYEEAITLTGGGPRFVFLETLAGPPQKQLVKQATTYKATQTGSAMGDSAYPIPPAPLWPAAEHVDRRSISRQHPKIVRGGFKDYTVTWSYEFESASPLA